MRGLNPEIKYSLGITPVNSYVALVHMSYMAEENLNLVRAERQLKRQQMKETSKNSQQLKVKASINKGKQVQASRPLQRNHCGN